jgi:hypothetical protein
MSGGGSAGGGGPSNPLPVMNQMIGYDVTHPQHASGGNSADGQGQGQYNAGGHAQGQFVTRTDEEIQRVGRRMESVDTALDPTRVK